MIPLLQQLNFLVAQGSIPAPSPFRLFAVYRTRDVFHKRDGKFFLATARVIGRGRDGMGRIFLDVEYSDGSRGQVTERGSCALGYPHACDLLPVEVEGERL